MAGGVIVTGFRSDKVGGNSKFDKKETQEGRRVRAQQPRRGNDGEGAS